ncbi:MAG: pyruvate, water dikinase regulatory protein [Maricaulis sp.]|jgi:regulator of PEP synthase PpsR (kinase-PPPase family)|uniref:pyruvate, water dikinase regulatory protein n=1 Tax=Maricaulis sp. TaxID=1486257 RepID=UPI001B212BA8|nr:pyruvate, water dikinase regulatory protein [Maricaulis sp.]MBO6730162.1 kinase/pyrophosphorylase [Maricaulis sp.]MBO6846235.1 kinase/pyrophosphorylase [Maricaulis sp.]MBO6875888.1 kinase/pyrophosphorylase [Maricaulis sp.]MDM7985631.1 pyruvate, water dikinase regulatory protein [Maricaulis sp.]
MTDTERSQIDTCFHIHMVSDSTGETLMEVMRASVAQFENTNPLEHLYALVRSSRQLDRVLEEIAGYPGVVMYTIVNPDLRRELETRCMEIGVPAIAVLDPMLATLSSYLARPIASRAGAQRSLDAQYYNRIEAMNYTMAHDDGQGDNFEAADIVLLGVSRTSKTPTSIYLAHRGYRAANIPLVQSAPLPTDLASLKNPLIVGLTASPERIVQIRRNRLLNLNEGRDTDYIDDFSVREEVLHAKRLYAKHGWPSIDVTRRSIEETAAKIINLLNEKRAQDA